VSLAIALSVPAALDNGGAFTGRGEIVFVTAGVIVLTLLVQGPLLPAVVRWARLPADTAAEDELRLAERKLTDAAVAALPDLAAEHGISDEVHDRLTREYREHLELVDARTRAPREANPEPETLTDGGETAVEKETTRVLEDSPLRRDEEYTRLRLAVLDRKREVLIRLRHEGVVDDSIARHIQTRLDIEELRLTGVEPLD
jgi:CPA1 family monovalent cation:H+ antiporter